jgi:hypothetical protein
VVPIAFGAAMGAVSTSFPVGDSDMWWHLATARETLARGLVRTDLFSWTVAGHPVGTDQWLGQLALYAGYALGEWRGVLAVRAIAVAVLTALLVAAAIARRPQRPLVAVVAALPALLLTRFVWAERPEVFGFVCFAALVLLLQLRGTASLVLIAPLLIVWANLHGSFALGAALALLVGAWGLRAEPDLRTGHLAAMAGAITSFVATPAGIGTLFAPGLHLLDPPRHIQEWTVPDPLTLAGAVWAVTLGAVIATAALAPPTRARDVLLLVPVAALSLMAARQMPLLAVVAAPYLADRAPDAWDELRRRIGVDLSLPALPRAAMPPRRIDAMAAALALAVVIGAAAAGPEAADESGYPSGALATLPSGPGLFAQYDWGGWLIWRAPASPVFIDGRLVPYRGDVVEAYQGILEARTGWRDEVERRGIRWILVRPHDPVAVRALDLGWRALGSERGYVLIAVP